MARESERPGPGRQGTGWREQLFALDTEQVVLGILIVALAAISFAVMGAR